MKIDLGQKYHHSCGTPVPEKSDKEKIHYPALYFTHDEPIDIPDEGTAVITFRKLSSGEDMRDEDEPKYKCEIEVRTFETKGGKKEEGITSMVDAFKEGLRKKMKRGAYEEDE